jgi:uncharacterized protein
MTTERRPISLVTPGTNFFVTVHRFGNPGARPRVYVQAALHADEIPGMLVAHHLRERLAVFEAAGRIRGEIILVPSANPIGLGQQLLGKRIGRFSFSDGVNFNRAYPYLVEQVARRIENTLTGDGAENVRLIRDALQSELTAGNASSPVEMLKRALLELALPSDLVLDLHCDSEAVVHLYTHTRSADYFGPLGALLGAQAVLLADKSGEDPFDEACSRPWAELADRFSGYVIPFACHSTTIELRGERDVDHTAARADAEAILGYLILREAIACVVPPMPAPRCEPTPLAGVEPITAPSTGIVVFKAAVGERLEPHDVVRRDRRRSYR